MRQENLLRLSTKRKSNASSTRGDQRSRATEKKKEGCDSKKTVHQTQVLQLSVFYLVLHFRWPEMEPASGHISCSKVHDLRSPRSVFMYESLTVNEWQQAPTKERLLTLYVVRVSRRSQSAHLKQLLW